MECIEIAIVGLEYIQSVRTVLIWANSSGVGKKESTKFVLQIKIIQMSSLRT